MDTEITSEDQHIPLMASAPPADEDDSLALVEAVAVEIPQHYVEVQAPADLPENYELTVQVDGGATTSVVLVPEGGVRKGQVFWALVLHPSVSVQAEPKSDNVDNGNRRNPHNIPNGQWRDSLCGCCSMGCFHPTCCLSLFCFPVLLGQVMTRMKLSIVGRPSNVRSMFLSPFKVITVGLIVVAGVHFSVARVINRFMDHKQGEDYASILVNTPSWVLVSQRLDHIMLSVVSVYLFVLVMRTRYHIRQTYSIPERCCGGCEDCCCAYWCGFCTVSQMARHTADYRTYQPYYCSETGLGEHAPPTLDATEV